MSFLEISGLSKAYGAAQVLHDIEISAEQGEFLVLVGPSGCGKSTLLNMIAGLESITSGSISIAGRVVNGVHPSRRNIAMVFQSYALYPNMTVAENITFGLEMHGVKKSDRQAAMTEVAELLQIGQLLDRKPRQLSGGQRQRVAMGRALVRNPDVFLFDEPLSNLDAKLRVDMRTEIKKLHQKLGTTIVYVTHDQIEAMTLSTRIAVMKDGRIQQLGTAQEIYDRPTNVFVASFMGSPPMNLLPGTIVHSDDSVAVEIRDADGDCHALPLPGPDRSGLKDEQNVVLGIRPEAVTDIDGADRNTECRGSVRTIVSIVETAGSDTFVTGQFSETGCVARMRADVAARPGKCFEFVFNMEKAVLFDPQSDIRIAP